MRLKDGQAGASPLVSAEGLSAWVSSSMKRAGSVALEAALEGEASQEEAAVAVYTAMRRVADMESGT